MAKELPERLSVDEQDLIRASIEQENLHLRAMQRTRAQFLSDKSLEKLDEGRVEAAIALAREALAPGVLDWPRVRSAEIALSLSVQEYRTAPQRLLASFVGHEGTVQGAIFSPDYQKVLTWSYDGTARQWDPTTGDSLAIMRHQAAVRNAVYSKTGDVIMTWSCDGTARLWEAETGREVVALHHHDVVEGAVFSNNEQRVLTWSFDGFAALWNAQSGERLLDFQADGAVRRAWLFDNDQRVIARAFSKSVRVWSAASGELLYELSHPDTVAGLRLLESSQRIVTWCDGDKSVRVYDARSGRETISVEHAANVRGIFATKDEARILTWAGELLTFWDAATGERRVQFAQEEKAIVGGAVLSADERHVLSWASDGTARAWDTETGRLLGTVHHSAEIVGARFSNDGTKMVTWSYDHTAQVRQIVPLSPEQTLAPQTGVNHSGPLRDAAFDASGNWVWTRSDDGTMRLCALRGLAETKVTLRHQAVILSWQFVSDLPRCLTASADGTARLWDYAPTDRCFRLASVPIAGGRFSPDAKLLMVWTAQGAHIWDISTRTEIACWPQAGIAGADLAVGGREIVTWDDGPRAKVWNAVGGEAAVLEMGAHVRGARYSPDGAKLLVWAGESGWLLRDTNDGALVRVGKSETEGAMFSPDGRFFVRWGAGQVEVLRALDGEPLDSFEYAEVTNATVSGSDDPRVAAWAENHRTVMLRAVLDRLPIRNLMHAGDVLGVVFSPGEDRILSWATGNEHVARIWHGRDGSPIGDLMHSGSVQITGGSWLCNGKRAVTWSAGATVLWDVESRSSVAVLRGSHSCDVGRVEQTIFTTQAGEWVVIDVPTGETIARLYDMAPVMAVAPDAGLVLDRDGQLWEMRCPPDLALQHANDVVRKTRPLFRRDRYDVYLGERPSRSVALEPERETAIRGDIFHLLKTGGAPAAHSTRARQALDVRLEFVVNAPGDAYVFHDQVLGKVLRRVEFNRLTRSIEFVFEHNVIQKLWHSIGGPSRTSPERHTTHHDGSDERRDW